MVGRHDGVAVSAVTLHLQGQGLNSYRRSVCVEFSGFLLCLVDFLWVPSHSPDIQIRLIVNIQNARSVCV